MPHSWGGGVFTCAPAPETIGSAYIRPKARRERSTLSWSELLRTCAKKDFFTSFGMRGMACRAGNVVAAVLIER